MVDTSDTETLSSVGPVATTFPCPWDEIPLPSSNPSELEKFDERSLIENLQTEYWWMHKTHVKTGPDANSNFRLKWLPYSSELRKNESRIELSEYQVVRECLWTLLGAGRGFLFACLTDTDVLTKNICLYVQKRACLTHLTHGALDTFCIEIAKYCTCVLRIRAFTDFILLTAPGAVPPPFNRLAESCTRLMEDTFRVISSLESDMKVSEAPPLTLINLVNKLQSWFRRLSFMSTLVLQVCSPQLSTIMSDRTSIILLNRLEELSNVLGTHLSDSYLVDLINNTYVSATEAYLSDLLDRSNLNSRTLSVPFLRYNTDFPPDSLMFWRLGITLVEASVPNVLLPIINEIFVGVKSVALLQTIGHTFRNPKIVEVCKLRKIFTSQISSPLHNEVNFTSDLFDDLELRELAVQLITPKKPTVGVRLEVPERRENSPGRILRYLRQGLKVELQRVSAQLCTYLLRGPLILTKELDMGAIDNGFHLTHLVNFLSDVCFLRVGDRMYEFSQALLSLSPTERTESEVNRILKEKLAFICGENSWLYERTCAKLDVPNGLSRDTEGLISLTLWIDIPWPLNIVITGDIFEAYQRIFNFLLMLKHAKWALDNTKLNRDADHHRLAILRSRFLFVINGLHTFIADQIETLHMKFMRTLAQGDNTCSLDTHMTGLNQYIARISQLCLVEDCTSQRILNQALRELFGLSLQFQLPNISEKSLAGEFSTRVAFLRTILSEAAQESICKQNVNPLLQTLDLAHRFNTDMPTRLHFVR